MGISLTSTASQGTLSGSPLSSPYYPSSFLVRFRRRNPADGLVHTILSITTVSGGGTYNGIGIAVQPGSTFSIYWQYQNTNQYSYGGTVTDSSWHSGGGQFESSVRRTVWLDGSSGVANTASGVPTGLNGVNAGCYIGPFGDKYDEVGHDIEELAIYSVVLSSADFLAHASGLTAKKIRPDKIVLYDDFAGGRSREQIGGIPFTLTSVTTSTSAPLVIRAGSPRIGYRIAQTLTTILGSGTLTSGTASLAGSGKSLSAGTGALASQSASLTGQGKSAYTGIGIIRSFSATMTGSALAESVGGGPVSDTAAAIAGSGQSKSIGNGTLTASPASVAGSAWAKMLGTGQLVAGNASVSGQTLRSEIGSGDLSAFPSAVSGSGGGTSTGAAKSLKAFVYRDINRMRNQKRN